MADTRQVRANPFNHLRRALEQLLLILAVLVWAPLACGKARAAEPPRRPNVVVFLADDLGWGDLGCYGNPRIQTPNLDAFARESVRFTQCYAACGVCSPSRAALLTGRTPYRNGVWRWIPAGSDLHLRESEATLPEILRREGYQTAHVGKWHLSGKFNSADQPQPSDHGYDYWFATANNAIPSHKNPVNFVRNGTPVGPLQGFSGPLVAREAVHWLDVERDPDRPFFLAVWPHEPHMPIDSDPRFMAPYADIEEEGIRQHHGNVTQLDYAFGMVMEALKKEGLTENTLVIFTSDNGPAGRGDTDRRRVSTGGLRGRKPSNYEGGIRVPGMVRWPRYFARHHIAAGTESDVPIIGSDIFATVLQAADAPLPRDRTLDGVSFLPALKGKRLRRSQPLFWRTHNGPAECKAALRLGHWKIIADDGLTRFQLYDLDRDPFERIDLATQKPRVLRRMVKRLRAHDAAVKAEGGTGQTPEE